jgi:hypothetical protein
MTNLLFVSGSKMAGFCQALHFNIEKYFILLRNGARVHRAYTKRMEPLKRLLYAFLSEEERREDFFPIITSADY